MILSAMRRYDAKGQSKEVQCSDLDFEVALSLCRTFNEHSQSAFKLLTTKNPRDLLYNLPMAFTTAQALEIGKSIGFSVRTIFRRQEHYCNNEVIVKDFHGNYQKAAKN